jgi:hypothetical protein
VSLEKDGNSVLPQDTATPEVTTLT